LPRRWLRPPRLHYRPLPLFLVCSPPPSSTLFPYTTLFRSPCSSRISDCRTRCRNSATPWYRAAPGTCPRTRPAAGSRASAGRVRDRKSTRLNSSHVEISYAVFCLKKKHNQCQATQTTGLKNEQEIALPPPPLADGELDGEHWRADFPVDADREQHRMTGEYADHRH